MGPQAGHRAEGERPSVPPRDIEANYRRLLATLASRARKFGSRDPESAAQETLRRSLENVNSQPAVGYYFGDDLPEGVAPPAWPLDQLLAWLHGVLRYVVREEQNRASYRRESSRDSISAPHLDPVDPMPDQLETLLQKELQGIIAGCFPKLDREYQTVLRMRVDGMKYGEIAGRLKISENTVATWVSRGIRALAQCVRRRTERVTSFPQTRGGGNPHA
jgi:RNA polymerase sigma factor (sigma-70 family)